MYIGFMCFIYGGYKCLLKQGPTKQEKRIGAIIAVLGYLFMSLRGKISSVRLYSNCYIINVFNI